MIMSPTTISTIRTIQWTYDPLPHVALVVLQKIEEGRDPCTLDVVEVAYLLARGCLSRSGARIAITEVGVDALDHYSPDDDAGSGPSLGSWASGRSGRS